MNIIFEYSGKVLILPVNPESIKITKASQSQKAEVIGIGEISVPQTRKLASITISSFFWEDLFNQNFLLAGLGAVSGYMPSVLSNAINEQVTKGINQVKNYVNKIPKSDIVQGIVNGIADDSQKFKVLNEYVKWFEEWQASKKPARFTVVVPPNKPKQCFDYNVTCENFTYEVKAGEEGDFYYELELLEWRNYGARVLKPEQQTDGTTKYKQEPENRLENKGDTPQEVKQTAKDSIWSTAKKYCKDKWKDLLNESANMAALSVSPQNLNGMILKIPKQYISRVGK